MNLVKLYNKLITLHLFIGWRRIMKQGHMLAIFYVLSTDTLEGRYSPKQGIQIIFKDNNVLYNVSTKAPGKAVITYRGPGTKGIAQVDATVERGIGQYTFYVNKDNKMNNLIIVLDTSRNTIRFDASIIRKQHKATAKNHLFGTLKIQTSA